MKNISRLCVMFLFLVLVVGCVQKKEVLQKEEKKTSWEKPLNMQMIHSANEGNFCIVSPGRGDPVIIPDLYIARATAYAGTTYKIDDREYRIEEMERYEIGIYDIHTLAKIKAIDMMKVMAPYMQDWQIDSIGFWIGEYNNKYYITQPLTKKQTEEEIISDKEVEYRKLWIDIEDETASWIDKEPNPIEIEEVDNIWMLVGTSILRYNGYEDTDVGNLYTLKDTSYIAIPTDKLPEKNEKLYELFPDLKSINREDGLYAHIYLHPQTNNMEAISLILNDGERLDFAALKPNKNGYYGSYAKNGDIHWITKDEYEQFHKDYEEYFNNDK